MYKGGGVHMDPWFCFLRTIFFWLILLDHITIKAAIVEHDCSCQTKWWMLHVTQPFFSVERKESRSFAKVEAFVQYGLLPVLPLKNFRTESKLPKRDWLGSRKKWQQRRAHCGAVVGSSRTSTFKLQHFFQLRKIAEKFHVSILHRVIHLWCNLGESD